MAEPESPTLEPAKPITADRLLELEEKQRNKFTSAGRIGTGCREIDGYVLAAGKERVEEGEDDDGTGGGGFERGIVMGLTAAEGDKGEGKGARLVGSFRLFLLRG
jgi:hypothetical protein